MTDHLERNSPVIDATREDLAKHMVEAYGLDQCSMNDVSHFAQCLVRRGLVERFRVRQGLFVYRLVPQTSDAEGRPCPPWFVCWKGDRGSHDAWADKLQREREQVAA